MDFKTDPNGFVIPIPPFPRETKAAEEAARKAAAAALDATTIGLGDRLLQSMHSTAGDAAAAAAAAGFPSLATSDDPMLNAAKLEFLKRYGAKYGYGGRIDTLYPAEVGDRMQPHEHYLDYTGSSVYANSQIDAVFQELRTHLFGNPHSANPSSSFASEKVEEARDMVLK